MLTGLFDRTRRPGRAHDKRSIEALCTALLAGEGEVSSLQLSSAIVARYTTLDRSERLAFFQFLNDSLELDVVALRDHANAYLHSGTMKDYRALTTAAEPSRQELFRRINQSTGATEALVHMRVDLMQELAAYPALKRTDLDLVHLLRSWFNRGFLVLKQVSWDTPATILDKIVAYEAVHAIGDWEDLRRRLYPPDRRCFAYFHPSMPQEPLIFVEVALANEIPSSISDVLAETREPHLAEDTKIAVFYSISNCQKGLRGISFGNLLIKQVVDELRKELPQLETFVTLSPIPRLNTWLRDQDADDVAERVLSQSADPQEVEAIASHFLLNIKDEQGMPLDPVARFHLGNGARVYDVHADADLTKNGLNSSSGAMVNYLYDLKSIESNHEVFASGGAVSASRAAKSKSKLYHSQNTANAT